MSSVNKLPIKHNPIPSKSNVDTNQCTLFENHINWSGFGFSNSSYYDSELLEHYKWDEMSPVTHPLDNLLDIAPFSIKQYYLENPPQWSFNTELSYEQDQILEISNRDTLTQSPRTLPSVLNPEFEAKNANQKQRNLLVSPNNLQHFSLRQENPIEVNKSNKENKNEENKKCAIPPALIFNQEKPKKRPSKAIAQDSVNDESNPMYKYYYEIMRNSKKKYRDMSPLSNIDGNEKYVDGIIGMPDDIPQDQIDKFNSYSKMNFICKKCGKTFSLVKACTYYNGGLCCVTCCSFIHRETVGLYDYMKDLYFEDEELYKCDRIIHYRPLWQFLKFEKKKKTWKIAKLCIYCRNLKSWEYLNKPVRRRKTIQQIQNEKNKIIHQQQQQQKQKQVESNSISSIINPDEQLIDDYNNINCCCGDISEMKCHDNNPINGCDDVYQPPKKRVKKSKSTKKVKFDYDEDYEDFKEGKVEKYKEEEDDDDDYEFTF